MLNWRSLGMMVLGSIVIEMFVQGMVWLVERRKHPTSKKAVEDSVNSDSRDTLFETIFFPESQMPCRFHYRNADCHRKDCAFTHEAALLDRLLACVTNSRHTLDVCVYQITCFELKNAILQAHRRGVRVRIITDGNAPDDVAARVAKFREAGVGLRTNPPGFLMHHKFVVVDDTLLLNGSFNWTWGAITGNHENIFITTNQSMVEAYAGEFRKLWTAYDPRVAPAVTTSPDGVYK